MNRATIAAMPCPLARALDVVGDDWALLVVRDALFFGSTRFEEFRRNLNIPTNVLSGRLRHLVEHGILEKRSAPLGNSLHEYRLTAKGEELWVGLSALLAWGNRWLTSHPDERLSAVHANCAHDVQLAPECPSCGGLVRAGEITFHPEHELPAAVRNTSDGEFGGALGPDGASEPVDTTANSAATGGRARSE